MTFEQACEYLSQFVKESAVPNQKHITKDMVNVDEIGKFDQAMSITQNAVIKGEKSRAELIKAIGLE